MWDCQKWLRFAVGVYNPDEHQYKIIQITVKYKVFKYLF